MNFNVSKMEDIFAASKLASLLNQEEETKKLTRTIVRILACIGAVAAVALITYGVYHFFFREDLEDFDDDLDFDDDDDLEDFFEDEDEEEEAEEKAEEPAEAEKE